MGGKTTQIPQNSAIDEISEENWQELLSAQLDQVEKLSILVDSIDQKLKSIYQDKFPKVCNSCGTIYETREDYLDATQLLQNRRSTIFDGTRVQEYRNCVCGSTLILLTEDRRDNTEYGIERRRFFDMCLDRLLLMGNTDKEEIRAKLRKLFRAVIDRAN